MRPKSTVEFEQLPLRAHEILAETTLYDVWAVDLTHWRSGITLSQFLDAAPLSSISMSPAARFLMRLRFSAGRMFGWDRAATGQHKFHQLQSDGEDEWTFVHRISTDDYRTSRVEPGTQEAGFRVVCSFANEHLIEVKNQTVHAALVVALVEGESAYRLYLGVFVAKVNRWTPYYMAAIAPFRRWIVYPSLLHGLSTKWDQTFGTNRQRI